MDAPPAFGPLAGLRILDSGRFLAGPGAATLAAELGARVIHVEPPQGELMRLGRMWAVEARNKLSLALDLTRADGSEIFRRLLRDSDIWIESSRPGTYERLGFGDDDVHRLQPRLVIVHVSGFGQNGDPARLQQRAVDPIIQAFSGLMAITGLAPPSPPLLSQPVIGDTLTAHCTLWAALAGYVSALRTGRGQSIDLAMYEVILRGLSDTILNYFNDGTVEVRRGNRHKNVVPWDTYESRDGVFFFVTAFGDSFPRLCRAIGEDPENPIWSPQVPNCMTGTPGAEELDVRLRRWVREHSAEEVEEALVRTARVPCQRVHSVAEMARDPHCAARENFVSWVDPQLGKVRGPAVVPRFNCTPGRVWRGAPRLGEDSREVLRGLGYGDGEIVRLVETGVVVAAEPKRSERKNEAGRLVSFEDG